MRAFWIVPIMMAGALTTSAGAEETLTLEDETDRASYSLGHQMGRDLRQQDVELDRAALLQGLEDGQAGAEPQMTPAEMEALLAELKRRIVAQVKKERQGESEAKKQAGIAFLEENKSKPGIQVTDSGLQYRIIAEGSGKRPGPSDTVRVHYRGRTIEGTEFDSSFKRGKPAEFALNQVIRGWGEGLMLMQEGAKYELFIPYQLAYRGRGPLAFQTLIFEVELLAVNPEAAPAEATKTDKQ